MNLLELQKLAPLTSLGKIADPDTFLFQKGSSWAEKGVKLKNLRINIINDLLVDGFKKGSSWAKKRGKLECVKNNKFNNMEFFDFQKGGSWAEKGGKLLQKRIIYVLEFLILCLNPMKIEEMKHLMSYGSREKLRELYIQPMKNDGLIQPVIKDKPNSPDQKYILTEKGRLFLGGFEI